MPTKVLKNSGSSNSILTASTPEETLHHVVEPELKASSVPRTVRLRQGTVAGFWIASILWMAAMVALGSFWLRNFNNWNALIEHGTVAKARVIDKYVSRGKASLYMLDCTLPMNQKQIQQGFSVSELTYAKTQLGSVVPFTYLSNTQEPIWQWGRATKAARDKDLQVWWVEGGIVSLLFIGILTFAYVLTQRQLWLLRYGSVTSCRVTGKRAPRKGYLSHSVRYRYYVDDKPYSGRADVGHDLFEAIEIKKSNFSLLYDPTNPSRSLPYFAATDAYIVTDPT